MSIIKVSIDKIYGILEPVDLELIKERVEVSNRMLSDGSGDGNDFLGWVDLPEQITPAQLDEIAGFAARSDRGDRDRGLLPRGESRAGSHERSVPAAAQETG